MEQENGIAATYLQQQSLDKERQAYRHSPIAQITYNRKSLGGWAATEAGRLLRRLQLLATPYTSLTSKRQALTTDMHAYTPLRDIPDTPCSEYPTLIGCAVVTKTLYWKIPPLLIVPAAKEEYR